MKNLLSLRSYILLLTLIVFQVQSAASELCKARIDCPGNYRNDTIKVARNVVALTKSFFHCTPDSVDEGYTGKPGDTISVFFIIDHSGSMSYMDSTAIRYNVVRSIIDSLAHISPASEVGLAVFSNQLLHSYKDDPFFTQLYPEYHDSYIPLTKLNDTLNGVAATDKLKWSIQLSNTRDAWGNYKLVNGNYSPTGRHDSLGNNLGYNGTTDISLAFEAAQKAFLKASYGKEHQYIVFLSDGISQRVDKERQQNEFDYINGKNVPATFTAFFINVNKPIPAQITTMTQNIKANGYSANNTASTIWKTMGSESELVSKLLGQFTNGSGTKYFRSSPVTLTINGITTTTFDDTMAYLPKDVPLTGKFTDLDISFTWHWDLPINKDQTARWTSIVMQTDSADVPSQDCFESGSLKFFYQGNEIAFIETPQKTLEVRLYTTDSHINSETVLIKVYNDNATDSLVLTARKSGNYYTATFNRDYGTAINDNILQNAFSDSVIATYKNPDILIDTLRIAARVSEPRGIAVQNAYYLDSNANGQPDVIRVIQGSEKLNASEDSLIKPYISIKTPRTLSINSVIPNDKGFDIILNEQPQSIQNSFTGLYPGERLYIDEVRGLPGGGSFPQTDIIIADSMAPVIVTATYYDQALKNIRDTLVVTFSECIDSVSHVQPFILKSNPSEIEYKLSLEQVSIDKNTGVFSVVPVVGVVNPQKRDSIKINPLANISDTSAIIQANPQNSYVTMDYYLLYHVISAAYFDTSGDGLIDVVRIGMDVKPDSLLLEELSETVKLPEYRKFNYNNNSFFQTEHGFEIRVTQPADMIPNTAVDERDVLNISNTQASNGSVVKETSVPIADSIAPVLISVRYIPGGDTGAIRSDSLIAVFSEEIPKIISDKPFSFIDSKTGESYSMTLQYLEGQNTVKQIFAIKTITAKEFPEVHDSVFINPVSNVKDESGNVQDSFNKPIEMEFEYRKIEFRILAYPLPFDPEKSIIPAKVQNYYGIKTTKGILMVAEPVAAMAGYLRLSGKVIIYDATGNMVCDPIIGKETSRSKGIAFVWDGLNRNKRFVGTGVYLAEFRIEDGQGGKYSQRSKIGVKRAIPVRSYYDTIK